MEEFYSKYVNYIVGILLSLFLFKSCQSCSLNRTIKYNDNKNSLLVDSLINNIYKLNKDIDSLENIIIINNNEILNLTNIVNQYKIINNNLNESNKYYMNTNKILINTNKQIVNSK